MRFVCRASNGTHTIQRAMTGNGSEACHCAIAAAEQLREVALKTNAARKRTATGLEEVAPLYTSTLRHEVRLDGGLQLERCDCRMHQTRAGFWLGDAVAAGSARDGHDAR